MAFDTTISFLGRHGWRITKNKVTGTWQFIQPIALKGHELVTKDGWQMVKSKTGDTWEIIQPKIINNKTMPVINGTVQTFKLVLD